MSDAERYYNASYEIKVIREDDIHLPPLTFRDPAPASFWLDFLKQDPRIIVMIHTNYLTNVKTPWYRPDVPMDRLLKALGYAPADTQGGPPYGNVR